MGGRRISVRIDGEGYKTRQAKELALEGTRSDTSNRTKSSQSAANKGKNSHSDNGNSRDINQLVKSNLMNLLGMEASTANNGHGRSRDDAVDPQQTALNQMAAQLKVKGPITNRVFVASLDYMVDERKLKEVFALAGNLITCEMFRDREGKSRGMAVIEYDTPFAALNAVSMFNHQTLMDRQMTVRFDAKEKDEPSPQPAVVPKLPSGLKSIGKSILPATNNAATDAIKSALTAGHLQATGIGHLLTGLGMNLNGTAPSLMGDSLMSTATKSMAQPLMGSSLQTNHNNHNSSGSHNISQNNNSNGLARNDAAISKVFIKNIPFTWDSRKLKDKFRQAGTIEFAEIKQKNGQSRGCALIRYSTAQQALKAVELFNGSRFEGRTLDVNLDKMA